MSRDQDSLIIPAQPATYIYENQHGAVVIRQDSKDPHDDDPFVFVQQQNLANLVTAIWVLMDQQQRASVCANCELHSSDFVDALRGRLDTLEAQVAALPAAGPRLVHRTDDYEAS